MCERPNTLCLYLLAGQSNARGRCDINGLSAENAQFSQADAGLVYAEQHTNWQTGVTDLRTPIGTLFPNAEGTMGPEMALADCVPERDCTCHCGQVGIIKFTVQPR